MGEMTTPRPLRHWALTGSCPSANVTLIILRVADLAAALLNGLLNTLGAFLHESATFWHPIVPMPRNSFLTAC